MMLVVVIMLILMGMAAPKMMQMISNQKLQASAQAYAGLLQEARSRAVQDDKAYEVLIGTSSGAPIAYVDLNDNGSFDATNEPAVLLASPIIVTDSGAPNANATNGFDTIHPLNIIPLSISTSPMLASDAGGTPRPGVAFNQRGLPCQRFVAGGNCVNAIPPLTPPLPPQVAWVTYFKYPLNGSAAAWAAISVTPAGRIKVWSFQSDGNNGGTWN
jgi:type II secretory pathway pseudopilin PulG